MILGTGRKFSVQSQAGALLEEPVCFWRPSIDLAHFHSDSSSGVTRLLSLLHSRREAAVALAYRSDLAQVRARRRDSTVRDEAGHRGSFCRATVKLCCGIDG